MYFVYVKSYIIIYTWPYQNKNKQCLKKKNFKWPKQWKFDVAVTVLFFLRHILSFSIHLNTYWCYLIAVNIGCLIRPWVSPSKCHYTLVTLHWDILPLNCFLSLITGVIKSVATSLWHLWRHKMICFNQENLLLSVWWGAVMIASSTTPSPGRPLEERPRWCGLRNVLEDCKRGHQEFVIQESSSSLRWCNALSNCNSMHWFTKHCFNVLLF